MADTAKLERMTCFIACPIGEPGSSTRNHADWLFSEILENVFDNKFPGMFELVRADMIDAPGMIDTQIIEHLLDDDLVIIDMTELNPNVFYEMGIRHMIEKPIIHVKRPETIIPFDVKLQRAIDFSFDTPSALKSARSNLERAVKAVLADDYRVENPIIKTRGFIELNKSATPENKLLADQIDTLNLRMLSIERNLNRSVTFEKPFSTFGNLSSENLGESIKIDITFDDSASAAEVKSYTTDILNLAEKTMSFKEISPIKNGLKLVSEKGTAVTLIDKVLFTANKLGASTKIY